MDGFDELRMVALVLMLVILFCFAIFMVAAVVVFFKTVIENYLWKREYRKERKHWEEQGWRNTYGEHPQRVGFYISKRLYPRPLPTSF